MHLTHTVFVWTLALATPLCLATTPAFAQAKRGGGARAGGEAGSTATGTSSAGERSAAAAAPRSGRTHDGHAVVGTAVPRTAERTRGTTTVPGGYAGFYPIGYGLGYGGYYGGYYDPWYGGNDPYVQPPAARVAEGAIKLKITPKQALVYVDGYFAGIVDDFDGLFQTLRLESGPHHIEVQAEGYEPLAFDVQITSDRTITYQGDLRKIQ